MKINFHTATILLFCIPILLIGSVHAQTPVGSEAGKDTIQQKDVIDVVETVLKHDFFADSTHKKRGRVYISVIPAAGYTLHTKLAATIGANAAFYTDEHEHANLSVINFSPTYTENKQIILPLLYTIWTKENKYNVSGDLKYYKYPQYTYGLGGHTTTINADLLDYSYLSVQQTVSKAITADLFAGIGYNLDYHWGITELAPASGVTDFQKYGKTEKSVSTGLSLNLLYDERRNSLNPPGGAYFNLVYRPNFKFMGSDQNWRSLVVDMRKYFRLTQHSRNILAFWSYNWITINGKPPYLDLPSTAWDSYANMGRGYIQSRFRGTNLIYLESEYRFGITRNGLFGGVVFINAQSVSEWPSNKFEVILPGYGAGLRVKINKHSNTNVALDYGFGIQGSQGIFVNLGEVF